MGKDKYKEQFATVTAEAFRNIYPDAHKSVGDTQVFCDKTIYQSLERPKDSRMGRFALPVFRYTRLLGRKPQDIADRVAEESNQLLGSLGESALLRIEAAGGFLNAVVDFNTIAGETIGQVLAQGEAYGDSDEGAGKTILVEYSSPNIAKPFGVGHLRTTILGNSLRIVFKKLGYKAVGINYPGDWGTQFGKMIVAFNKWGSDKTLQDGNVEALLDLYVRFHKEAESDPSLDDEARNAFKKLEEGDPAVVKLWEQLKKISHAEFDRIYGLLGVEFDLVIGESFFNDKMDAFIERLDKHDLTRISDGALIVDLDDPNLPPALLRKADGATLYVTRDLAGMAYRWEKFRFCESLYVVAASQSDHFKQCMGVVDKLEAAEDLPPEDRMIGRVKHIGFGWVKFGKKAMSTRRGNIIFLEDVIDKAVATVRDIIQKKNPDLKDHQQVAHMVGVGAVVFSQLSVKRMTDVNFVWEEVLSFDGETAPYLQYTHARLCSLLRNYPGTITPEIDISLLENEEEKRVVEHLADFPEAVNDTARHYDPYYVVNYLLKLAGAFNTVYQRKTEDGTIDKIISDAKELSAARIALVKAIQIVLNEGLRLLGIRAPEEM